MVGRRVAGTWSILSAGRRKPEGFLPLMEIPPEKIACDTWIPTQSVYPWVVISEFEVDELEVESDTEDDDWNFVKEVDEYAEFMMDAMPFARACSLEGELKDVIRRLMRNKITPNAANYVFAAMCDRAILYRMPEKKKDSGQFELTITIGNQVFERCLCDLGAGCNTIPLSAYAKMNFLSLKPTKKEMRLADDSSTTPLGKLTNIPVMIGDRFVAVDFYVLERCFEENDGIEQIILGRSFLKTVGALIDCENDTITLRNLGSPYLVFDIKKKDDRNSSKKKVNVGVITRSKPRMRVIEEPERTQFKRRSTPLPAVGRRERSPEKKFVPMTPFSVCEDEIQSTSLWILPEHVEPLMLEHVDLSKETGSRFDSYAEYMVEQLMEIWPLVSQCDLKQDLEELVPFVLRKHLPLSEFCARIAKKCDAVIYKSIPKKPRRPSRTRCDNLFCMIGRTCFDRVPCDTGAGANIMSFNVFELLKFEELTNERRILRFADDSYKMSEGLLKNVPLRVNGRFFVVDFHVMKYDNEPKDPLILGMPFLHSAYAEIDCELGIVKFKTFEEIETRTVKMNGGSPKGFEPTAIKGVYTACQKFKNFRQEMVAASIRLVDIPKKVEIIDLTSSEEDPEEDPMEDEGDDESSSSSPGC